MKDEIESLIKEVRQVAYELHVYLGNGLLEKVYENGLRHRLERAGFRVEAQQPLTVYDDDGVVLGAYFADLIVNGCLLVELKAVKALASEHVAQLLNYLTITHQPAGLLVNFGSYKFETRIVRASSPRSPDLHVKTSSPYLFGRGERVERGDPRASSPRSPDLHG